MTGGSAVAVVAVVMFTVLVEVTLLSTGETDHAVWCGAFPMKVHSVGLWSGAVFRFVTRAVNEAMLTLVPRATPFDVPNIFAKFACEGFIFFVQGMVNGSGRWQDRGCLFRSEVFCREKGGVPGSGLGFYRGQWFYILGFA